MKTIKLHVIPYKVPLKHAFGITHGISLEQENVIVRLECRKTGIWGSGEAATSMAYPHTVASLVASFEQVRSVVENAVWVHPAELWTLLEPILGPSDRFALCALDMAAHDLWAQQLKLPVWAALGLQWNEDRVPASNYTIGIDHLDKMKQKLREFPGWPIYKIKLGHGEGDLDLVAGLREETDAIFRVDANTGWTASQTLAFAPVLKELGVEFIEQPLPTASWREMEEIRDECALPLIADESCQTRESIPAVAKAFHGFNLKLTKAGGLTEALEMIAAGRRLDLKVMAGCMKESTVGISALAQLLPLLDAVDMDGALLLGRDIATGVEVKEGKAWLPAGNGLGIAFLPDFSNLVVVR